MGLLSDILSKVLGGAKPAAPAQTNSPAADAPTDAPAEEAAAPAAAAPAEPVDIDAVMAGFAAQHEEGLNWKESIVDLLKVLGLDSSHEARLHLADELHYTGDREDSAAMNSWLHEQVMAQLAQNGGKLPADLHN